MSQAYDPYLKTVLAPGNIGNGHGGATIDHLSDTLGLALVDTVGGYVVNDEHDLLADLGVNIVSNGQATLSSVAFHEPAAGGIAIDAADLTGGSAMANVGDGTESVDAIVFYDDTIAGDALLVYIDSGTGFGFFPNLSTVEVAFDSGDNRLWRFGS